MNGRVAISRVQQRAGAVEAGGRTIGEEDPGDGFPNRRPAAAADAAPVGKSGWGAVTA